MKVYFIGAGPGAADLITIRGADILKRSQVVLYAGSLVPEAVLTHCKSDAQIIDTSSLNLDQQIEHYTRARDLNYHVARVHSGDPAIYGATAEQMRRLEQLGIEYEIVPGVSSFTAAAAAIQSELTKPTVSQTIILTRVSGRASQVPDAESIANLATHGATLCVFLSGPHLPNIITDVLKHYRPETPIALVYRASCPDERKHISTLGKVLDEIDLAKWKLTTMLLVGDVLSKDSGEESCLYSADYAHKFRKASIKTELP